MTDAEFDKLIEDEMLWAIQEKTKRGVASWQESDMRIQIVLPSGAVVQTPFKWKTPREKQLMGLAASTICMSIKAQAVMLTSDTFSLKTEEFCKHFGLEPPSEPTWEAVKVFNEEISRIIAKYDGTMRNLPPGLTLNLWVSLKGPGVLKVRATRYRIDKGMFVFEPCWSNEKIMIEDNIIPNWWS